MLNKIILPVAGLGTRLLSVTKEQPKEMLPIFSKDKFNEITLNPIIQIIFEQLYEEEFRNFCFVVGKSKRIIEDHFTPDLEFLHSLENKNKPNIAKTISDFYSKINNSSIAYLSSPGVNSSGLFFPVQTVNDMLNVCWYSIRFPPRQFSMSFYCTLHQHLRKLPDKSLQ